jgi:hypothetical protein
VFLDEALTWTRYRAGGGAPSGLAQSLRRSTWGSSPRSAAGSLSAKQRLVRRHSAYPRRSQDPN